MLWNSTYSILSISNLIAYLLDTINDKNRIVALISVLVINFILLIWDILNLSSKRIIILNKLTQGFIILLRASMILWSFWRLIGSEKSYISWAIILFMVLVEINLVQLHNATIFKSILRKLTKDLINLKLRVKLRLIRTYYSVNGRRFEDYAYSDQYLDDIIRVRNYKR